MIIDNGTRTDLVISGVFIGTCGLSRGRVSFIPNRAGKRAEDARGALLNGEPILLADIQLEGVGPSYSASYRTLS